jgi:hypothetical protein
MNWTDLISADQSGVIHVDCCFGDEQEVERLRIWVATARGEWRLAGEYCYPRSRKLLTGMNFEGGYRSEKLASTLDTLFEHQHCFGLRSNLDECQRRISLIAKRRKEITPLALSAQ